MIGTSAYIMFSKMKKESFESPSSTQISWLLEKMGEDTKTGGPLMRVRVNFQGKINQGYDVGTYTGDCFEIAKSKWELLENEISGVICGWADWGDEIGVFKEGNKFVIKHGTLGAGRPATEDEPAIPNFRGDFKPLLEMTSSPADSAGSSVFSRLLHLVHIWKGGGPAGSKIKWEGWIPYEFHKTTDYGYTKPFRLFYPPEGRIEKATEFSASGYSSSPPDKLLFEVNNKKCWMIMLPPGMGIEEPPADFSSEEKDIDIAGKKWGTLIWRVRDKITFYSFYNKDNTNYSFSVNPETLGQCFSDYKKILSTFKFTD